MSDRDERKLNLIIELVRLAEAERATIKGISRKLSRRGYTPEEINAAWAYLAD